MNETEYTWTTIDGNQTKSNPVAYCKTHKCYLTAKQLTIHKCIRRECIGLRKLPHEFWDKRAERKKMKKERRKHL